MTQYTFSRLQPEYKKLWDAMIVQKVAEAKSQARKVIAHKDRYLAVEKTTGVPWFVIGCIHMRESGGTFNTWLHNGDPMKRNGVPVQTVQKPYHRPPNPDCTWEEGAYDALVTVEHLDTIKDWNPERVAYALEVFNGWGYRNPSHNIPSPYLWGGTNDQVRGKYVEDGKYDANTMDSQIGGMAVLREILELDPTAVFKARDLPSPTPPSTPTPKTSPKAEDTETSVEKPQLKRKTVWGGILGFLGTIGSTIAGFFDKLDNPYTLAAFVFIIVVACVAAYLVFKGRNDAQAMIEHLATDDSEEQ